MGKGENGEAMDIDKERSFTTNPLKNSQPLGALIAFLGVDRAIPMMHGCQGCSAFIRALVERHYREPVYVKTTALTETRAIMGGGEDVIVQGLEKSIEQWSPETIGLITTGLTEVKGDSYKDAIKEFRRTHPEHDRITIIPVSTPDYTGCLQEGYAKAVMAMIEELVEETNLKEEKRVNLLPGSFLTPADVWELKEVVSSFGFNSTILPDISGSYDGHLEDEQEFIARGGVKAETITRLADASFTLSFGESMHLAGKRLADKGRGEHFHFDAIFGLKSFDELIKTLSKISGITVPARFKRERGQLLDAMIDAHSFISDKKMVLGLEPDLMLNISKIIDEMGGDILLAVSPVETPLLKSVNSPRVIKGDLSDLELSGFTADIIISNTNAKYIAEQSGVPLLRIGFPVTDMLGVNSRVTVGYKGAVSMIFEIGNLFCSENNNREER